MEKLLFTSLLFVQFFTFAQPGSVLSDFNTMNEATLETGGYFGYGPSFIQTNDNALLAFGGSGAYQGRSHDGIIKILPNGRIDNGFVFTQNVSTNFTCAAIDQEGSFYVGAESNGTTPSLQKINSKGTLLSSFDGTNGPNGEISEIIIASDQKIVLLGNFTHFGGVGTPGICRMNADGTLDNTFQVNGGANNEIKGILDMNNGKLMVYGSFTNFNNTPCNGLVILNENGTVATSFSESGPFLGAKRLQDGRLIAVRHHVNAGTPVAVFTLENDETLTPFVTFPNAQAELNAHYFERKVVIAEDAQGDIYINNLQYQSAPGATDELGLFKINASGLLDDTFFNAYTNNSLIRSLISDGENGLYISDHGGGDYPESNPVFKIHTDGTFDDQFNLYSESTRVVSSEDQFGDLLHTNADNVIIGGLFNGFSGTETSGFVSLNDETGAVDTRFVYPGTSDETVFALEKGLGDKFYAAGDFNNIGANSGVGVVRYLNIGVPDVTFNSPLLINQINKVFAVEEMADGKVAIGGFIHKTNTPSYLQLLNVDGSNVVTFNTFSNGPNNFVHAIQSVDASLYVGGEFTQYNNLPAAYFIKVGIDGAQDMSFTPVFDGPVRKFDIDSEGRFLILGDFNNVNGIAQPGICRLMQDGTIDPSFDLGTGFNNSVLDYGFQEDGKIIFVGKFTAYQNEAASFIVRLDENGNRDPFFKSTNMTDRVITRIAIFDDETAMIRGAFQQYQGEYLQYSAKIELKCLPADVATINTTGTDICLGTEYEASITGRLHGSDTWAWYKDSITNPSPIYANEISDDLEENAVYYVRAEGGCAGNSSFSQVEVAVHSPDTLNITEESCTAYYWSATGLTYESSGSFVGQLTNQFGCDSVIYLDLFIEELDPLGVDLAITQDSLGLRSTRDSDHYHWHDCTDGSLITHTSAPYFTPQQEGTYFLKVDFGTIGCQTASECVDWAAPAIDQTGIDELDFVNATVYPNPTSGNLWVTSNVEWNNYEIHSMDGKMIAKGLLNDNQFIQLNHISTGVFFLKLESEGVQSMVRVVKN